MLLASLAIVGGLLLLVWSADRFVEGAVAVAAHYAVPPLLIGMIIIGFGTSAPEMMVSTIAASNGNPGLALGNAYGSNIANIGLILGMTAMICPIAVQSVVVKKEISILVGITGLSALLLIDGDLSRIDAFILLGVFVALMAWSVFEGMRNRNDAMGLEMQEEIDAHHTKPAMAFMWILVGLALLIGSSHLLVWGAVEIATGLGVSDLVIGLTVVAVGTSLPEFAASMAAARKGQADLALGNILGSNLFNTLVVVGIAGVISPFAVPQEILDRDIIVVGLFTVSLFVVCFSFKGTGIINRLEGTLLLAAYVGYTAWLIMGITGGITGG